MPKKAKRKSSFARSSASYAKFCGSQDEDEFHKNEAKRLTITRYIINLVFFDSEPVKTCLEIVTIRVILILNKARSLDMFENRINSYHIDYEQG